MDLLDDDDDDDDDDEMAGTSQTETDSVGSIVPSDH